MLLVEGGKKNIHKLETILCNISLSVEARLSVRLSYIEAILLYGSNIFSQGNSGDRGQSAN